MKKKILIALCLIVLMGVMGYIGATVAIKLQHTEQVADTVRVTVTDTVPYYKPVPKDSLVVKYVTKVLAVKKRHKDTCDTIAADTCLGENYAQIPQENMRDSVAVEIPITQKRYETEDYRAYVSGFEPNLDSIFLYRKTITERITTTAKPNSTLKNRFGFGVVAGAGYGIIHKQPDIFVGGAVYFRIWP